MTDISEVIAAPSGSSTAYAVVGLDPTLADELRRRGGPIYVADTSPGYPCRQCLRDALVGEELILVSHDPFHVDSPYRCASPIFLHRSPCDSHRPSSELPVQLTGRVLSVRAFDRDAMMVVAALIDGAELGATIDRLLESPATDHLHVHNAHRGCFAARIDRIGS